MGSVISMALPMVRLLCFRNYCFLGVFTQNSLITTTHLGRLSTGFWNMPRMLVRLGTDVGVLIHPKMFSGVRLWLCAGFFFLSSSSSVLPKHVFRACALHIRRCDQTVNQYQDMFCMWWWLTGMYVCIVYNNFMLEQWWKKHSDP